MKDYSKEIGFWKRLESFVKDINVSDYPGQEEKDMILHVCELKILDLQNVMPRFSKEPVHIKRGARTLNVKGYTGINNKPEATITCIESWDDDGTGLYQESDDNQWATFYLRGEDIDPIIEKLLEIKGFLNMA